MSLLAELKRRNVFRVGIAYVLLGWAVLQGADFVLDLIGAPEWVIRAFAVAGVVGLPFVLFFAWAFELTPEGIKREQDVDRSRSLTTQTGRRLNALIIGLLLVVIALMAVERMFFAEGPAGHPELPSAAAVPKSIAVLPFADLSQAGDQEWFADGLAEEILNALGRVPDLSVAARTSSFAYRGTNQDIPQDAADLGVAHVLEGSVRNSGERIRVTAQLIRASDGFHLWSQTYDRNIADMIGIQEDLARSIATALETTMDPEALAQMSQAGTASVEAYQQYLRGLQLTAQADTYSLGQRLTLTRQAYDHFERARALDPGFSDAHAQAARFWRIELTPNRMESGLSGLTPREMLREYYERIDLAITTAQTEADRLRTLADRAYLDLRLREARQLFERYLEMRPNDRLARNDLTFTLLMLSDNASALENIDRWADVTQTDVNSALNYVETAWRAGDYVNAGDYALQAARRWPTTDQVVYQSHRALLWARRYAQASELAELYESIVPAGHPLMRARQACVAGDRETAESILEGLEPANNNFMSQRWLAPNLLGRQEEERELMRGLAATGVPFLLSTYLYYPQFDPRPYPELMSVLEREGVQRPPPIAPPFNCPPAVEREPSN